MVASIRFLLKLGVIVAAITFQPVAWAKSDNSNGNNSGNTTANNGNGNSNGNGSSNNGNGSNTKPPVALGNVSAIRLKVAKVIACGSDDTGCVRINNNLSLDWLELVNNPNSKQLSNIFLPPNTKQLRFVLEVGSSITVNGRDYPLFVPSGIHSGLKVLMTPASMTEGFIQSLQLDFVKEKMLMQKTYKKQIVYTMKPLVKAVNVMVQAVPTEEHPYVLAKPDVESRLNVGNDFEMVIPAGAVTEPTLISVTEEKYFYETPDPVTGALIVKPMIASNY